MQDDDEEVDFYNDEINDFSLFDISDVVRDFHQNKAHTHITLSLRSGTPFNLMRYYLALKDYVCQMESEMGIFDDDEKRH